ncbi:hypothetical protein [Streptomyces sp. NPDC002537]
MADYLSTVGVTFTLKDSAGRQESVEVYTDRDRIAESPAFTPFSGSGKYILTAEVKGVALPKSVNRVAPEAIATSPPPLHWYPGKFEQLKVQLIGPQWRNRDVKCQAAGNGVVLTGSGSSRPTSDAEFAARSTASGSVDMYLHAIKPGNPGETLLKITSGSDHADIKVPLPAVTEPKISVVSGGGTSDEEWAAGVFKGIELIVNDTAQGPHAPATGCAIVVTTSGPLGYSLTKEFIAGAAGKVRINDFPAVKGPGVYEVQCKILGGQSNQVTLKRSAPAKVALFSDIPDEMKVGQYAALDFTSPFPTSSIECSVKGVSNIKLGDGEHEAGSTPINIMTDEWGEFRIYLLPTSSSASQNISIEFKPSGYDAVMQPVSLPVIS